VIARRLTAEGRNVAIGEGRRLKGATSLLAMAGGFGGRLADGRRPGVRQPAG